MSEHYPSELCRCDECLAADKRIRTDNERLHHALLTERGKLEKADAENERLRRDVAAWRAAYDASRANEERLRGLLLKLLDEMDAGEGYCTMATYDEARAALGATDQQEHG